MPALLAESGPSSDPSAAGGSTQWVAELSSAKFEAMLAGASFAQLLTVPTPPFFLLLHASDVSPEQAYGAWGAVHRVASARVDARRGLVANGHKTLPASVLEDISGILDTFVGQRLRAIAAAKLSSHTTGS